MVAANDRAQELLRLGALLSDHNGLLHLTGPNDDTDLQRLLD